MTSNCKQLIALSREFVARGGSVDERIDSLILRGAFSSADEQARWLDHRDRPPSPFASVQVYDTEIAGDLQAGEAFANDRAVSITIVKPVRDGIAVFVFSSGFVSYLRETQPLVRMLSAELGPRSAFQARGLDVGEWDVDQPLADPPASLPLNVREFVRDYVPAREIVDDISPWIVATKPAVESPEFLAWRNLSARRLLGSLVNSASSDGGTVWLQVSGPPNARVRADDPNVAGAWENLTNCARWVFLAGPDIEVRHIIFAAELARAYRPDTSFSAVLDHALEAAKTTYEAHVQSASRETLKVLADLRKSVVDDTQNVTARAQELTGGLWRDLTVSAAPFVLTFFADEKKPVDAGLAAAFYFASAAFIVVSFMLQVRIQADFLNNQAKARERWLRTLHGSLSPTERLEIAEAPVAQAVKGYRGMRLIVGAIYLVLVFVLIAFGVASLGAERSAAVHHVEKLGSSTASNTPPHGPVPVVSPTKILPRVRPPQ